MDTWLHYTIVFIAGGLLIAAHGAKLIYQDWIKDKTNTTRQEPMITFTGCIMASAGMVSLVVYVIVKSWVN